MKSVTVNRDEVLIREWKERHEAGTCGVCCYICVKGQMQSIFEENKKKGTMKFV